MRIPQEDPARLDWMTAHLDTKQHARRGRGVHGRVGEGVQGKELGMMVTW